MSKIRPLRSGEAKRTLVARLGRVVDSARQHNTRFGLRPYRVFMIWTKWSGEERGQGMEKVLCECEILPTPRVVSLDKLSFTPFHAGVLPVGSLTVDEISPGRYTNDVLRGNIPVDGREALIGPRPPGLSSTQLDHIPEPYDFFYEVVQDERNGCAPVRERFQLLSMPFLDAENFTWRLMLERTTEDRNRDGSFAHDQGTQG